MIRYNGYLGFKKGKLRFIFNLCLRFTINFFYICRYQYEIFLKMIIFIMDLYVILTLLLIFMWVRIAIFALFENVFNL
jgi:hypothetical protein